MPPQSAALDSGTKYHHLYPQKLTLAGQTAKVDRQTSHLEGTASASLQGAHLADAGEGDFFRCPLSITGFGLDSRVFAPAGEDSLTALQHAIGLAGQVIDDAVRKLNLINPLNEVRERHYPGSKHFDGTGYPDWLYRYDSRPDTDYGLWGDR